MKHTFLPHLNLIAIRHNLRHFLGVPIYNVKSIIFKCKFSVIFPVGQSFWKVKVFQVLADAMKLSCISKLAVTL
jgi:hypothetical protein